MDSAVLSWTKVFGGKHGHWRKHLAEVSGKKIQVELHRVLGGEREYENFRDKIRCYRDTYVAHHDFDETKRAQVHPNLDELVVTAEVLYEVLFECLKLENAIHDLPRPEQFLGEARQNIQLHWREIVSTAGRATKHFQDVPDIGKLN